MRSSSCFALAALSLSLLVVPSARAQDAEPVDPESAVGYELALHGAPAGERGSVVRLEGTAYEVSGLADLRPTAGLEIEAQLTVQRRDARGREVVRTVRAQSGPAGRLELEVPVPVEDLPAPRLEIRVARAGSRGRLFYFPFSQLASRSMEVLTDRSRYQPGETLRIWTLLRGARDRAPISSAPIVLRVHDASGTPIAERRTETGSSGATSFEVPIPESAALGAWSVVAVVEGAPAVSRSVAIVRRTVERLAVEVTLEREVVEPGAPLRGRVRVTTPSGSPVRGARVTVLASGDDEAAHELVTDEEGFARIDVRAPSFLSGDVAAMQVVARASHPAHGALAASAPYTLARTRWVVSATPEAGGLVPELDTELYLAVADPRGRPIPAGVAIEVRGLGVANGRARATTDARGLASIRVRLPRGAAARAQGGACAGQPSTSFEVEVHTQPATTLATVCARVALDAQVLARLRAPIAAPGSRVDVDLVRRPASQRSAVLVEALAGDRAVAFAWADAGARSATLALPDGLQGVLWVRARPVSAPDATKPLREPGAALVGAGTLAALVVRPADAFALDVAPERALYRVRERARIDVRASVAPERGWIALLARDEAAHGGEQDFALEWARSELREVLSAPFDPADERYLRAALAAGLPLDGGVREPPPLVQEPWDQRVSSTGSAPTLDGGVLRDPIAAREELRRRGLAAAMRAVERAVERLGADAAGRAGLVRAVGARVELDRDAIEHVVRLGFLAPSQARTLGGQPLTVAMIERADPSFTFDRIATRVARARLVRLLVALARFADPDAAAALRASAGEPPERWLARVVQLGMVPADALIDPWGRPFAFHRVGGRGPAILVSARAPGHELASPGPDGRLGTADDVRDPFARAVPEGTPYAVISGEDRLMQQLSRIAPGEPVLRAMASAYQRLGLAAEEERRAGPVTATVSEADAPALAPPPPAEPMPAGGAAVDAGGGGYGRGGGAVAPAAPSMRVGRGRAAERDDDAMAEEQSLEQAQGPRQQAGDRFAAMGSIVREDFPATLFFVGEVALDGSGTAQVTVPLADALTTYRLEAIGWSQSGWITSGRGRARVDQEAMVDAPVPPIARAGDELRLPVRIQNRTREPLRVRLEVAIEGGLDAEPPAPLEVPPLEAREAIAVVRARSAGQGAIVVRALREDGTALDAVRRPIVVIEDARRVVEQRRELVRSGDAITVEIPAGALARGPGQLRVALGGAIVGDPAAWALESDAAQGAWALAMAQRELPEALRATILAQLPGDPDVEEGWFYGHDLLHLATVLGAAWSLPGMSEAAAGAALRAMATELGQHTEEFADERDAIVHSPAPPSALLIALAPAIRDADRRPAIRDDLLRTSERLRRLASAEGARAAAAPETWARVAAALALSRRGEDDPRAREMLRRADRHVFATGDQAWLEPDQEGAREPRAEPTALLALARIAIGEPEAAMPLLRSLGELARGAPRWEPRVRALASAAAATLTRGELTDVTITLDGRAVPSTLEGGIATASLDGLGTAGTHRVELTLPRGTLALATLDLRYALPWSVVPPRRSGMELGWQGELGARDTRAGLLLTIHNRGARVQARPIVEIELPAGAELDEPTREAIGALCAAPPELEGATLRLHLRPLAPGGFQSIPVRARWSLGGTLRGLGASAWDDATPARSDVRAVAVLPSRELTLADEGPEPAPPEADASPPPGPRPPEPPIPMPRPLSEVAR